MIEHMLEVMNISGVGASAMSQWEDALRSLQSPALRAEFALEEVPAPSRLAPNSIALAVEAIDSDDEELAVGRFIVLNDPDGQDTWDGSFRVVTFVRAPMELDVVTDGLFDEVAWSWLTDSLTDAQAAFHNVSGTVTRTISRSFAGLEDRAADTDLEIRASWSPDSADLTAHLNAWLALVEKCAGLMPLPAGVSALTRKR
jgi:tRNA threonylcarbamoyladenosine modification (KEOPS) complex  Pcc1 subunit